MSKDLKISKTFLLQKFFLNLFEFFLLPQVAPLLATKVTEEQKFLWVKEFFIDKLGKRRDGTRKAKKNLAYFQCGL